MTPTLPPQSPNPRIPVRIDAALEELIPTFLANRRRDVDTMRRAVADSDFAVLQTLGHRMKGDGGGYGFEGISEIGAILEGAAARKDRESILRQIDKLGDYLDRIEVVFV